ncbi:MAG: GGDEF domain-containing protein [Firmicutes bacterium]|nr:GGDEF domain-containing protein [Bacillota bacterium]
MKKSNQTLQMIVKKLTSFNKMYDEIRVVDPVNKEVVVYHDGIWEKGADSCYTFWKTGKICDNCTSMRALNLSETIIKTKYINNVAFLITSIPTTIDNRKVVLELLKDITNSIDMIDDRVIELKKVIDKTNELITKDTLTNIFNKRYINERLPVDQAISSQINSPFCLIMADIDNFKVVNDSYGHIVGDYTLKTFAKIIQNKIRNDHDWFARFGGEEFIICLNHTTLAAAKIIANQYREAIEKYDFVFNEQHFNITASFGVVENQEIDTPTTLIDRADQNLFVAKNSGRNLVI